MMVELLLSVPLIVSLLCLIFRRNWSPYVSLAGMLLVCIQSVSILLEVNTAGPIDYGLWYVDRFSALMIVLSSSVSTLIGIYSIGYLRMEVDEGLVRNDEVGMYHVFMQLFLFTMILVVVVDSLGLMWIAIEATTLTSAFLVGFHRDEKSLEATWKYLIICSVGIALALMSVTLVYASSLNISLDESIALDWSILVSQAGLLDPSLMKLSFIFALAGYGTKAGLVPMHTWLPDAHSQAPSPVSAMMSALLLNCAMYGIIRIHVLTDIANPGFSSTILLGFGLLSVAAAGLFMMTTKDLKRLLAYSSIEHMGIIAIGFGIGGPWGVGGAVFQMVAHSLTKSLLFLSAGDLIQVYGTRDINEIRGILQRRPLTGAMFTLGSFAIVGMPPFSIFIGEALIIYAAIGTGNIIIAIILVALLFIVFASFTHKTSLLTRRESYEAISIPISKSLPMVVLLMGTMAIGLFMAQGEWDFIMEICRSLGAWFA